MEIHKSFNRMLLMRVSFSSVSKTIQMSLRIFKWNFFYCFLKISAANGKWPNNLAVIEQIKAAFYVRIAQGMQEQFKLPARGNTQCVEIIKSKFNYLGLR